MDARGRETEFRGRAFPNRVWEREQRGQPEHREHTNMRKQVGVTRREVLRSLVGGSLVLPGIVAELLAAEAARAGDPRPPADPLAPRPPHYTPRARRVIFLFST